MTPPIKITTSANGVSLTKTDRAELSVVREPHRCEACGAIDTLTITATLIECKHCGTLWGRVNGFWIECPKESR